MSDTQPPPRPTWNEGLDFLYGTEPRVIFKPYTDEEMLERCREFVYDNPGITLPHTVTLEGHTVTISRDRWTGRLVCKR